MLMNGLASGLFQTLQKRNTERVRKEQNGVVRVTFISRLFTPTRSISKQLESFWSDNAVSRRLSLPCGGFSGRKFWGWNRPNQKSFVIERQMSFWSNITCCATNELTRKYDAR